MSESTNHKILIFHIVIYMEIRFLNFMVNSLFCVISLML